MGTTEIGIQNVIEGRGIEIAITGMAIVFVALTLITAFIALLPKIVGADAAARHPESERPRTSPAHLPGHIEDEVLAAIGFALHREARGGSSAPPAGD